MAMYVILASKRADGSNNYIERHVGGELPTLTNEEVISLQADGHELDYIVRNFQDIPMAWYEEYNKKFFVAVQRWFGDHAKFIYHNLRW